VSAFRVVLIIADAALEIVPEKIGQEKCVIAYSKRVNKKPSEILLDRSYHHRAMKRLENAYRRGRPDIVHFCLMEVVHSPLYFSDLLKVFVHTYGNQVIEVFEKVRLPKEYSRFKGLMEKLLMEGKVEHKGALLLRASRMDFKELATRLNLKPVIGLSRFGKRSTYEEIAKLVIKSENPALVVGGFPKGEFTNNVLPYLNELFSISERGLEAHIVVARLIYEVEKLLLQS